MMARTVATFAGGSYIPVMLRRAVTFVALLAMGSLEAVVAAAGAPSLARRPAELRDRAATPAPPAVLSPALAPSAVADPALPGEVSRIASMAEAADAAFTAALQRSSGQIASARQAAIASEAWVVSQNAVSALDSLRYDSVTGLASLDSLRAARLRSGALTDVAVIDPVQARLLAMVDVQNDQLDHLKAQLRAP